jgi:S1-C subfamily serine protease
VSGGVAAARSCVAALLAASFSLLALAAHADRLSTIARVKASVVAVGTYQRARAPPFQFRGTGFAIGDGATIVTNAHVLPADVDAAKLETLAILLPGAKSDQPEIREARAMSVDPDSDLALLRIDGAALPALKLRESDDMREGQEIFLTGFPIGSVLGPYPATHRGMISAVTPIAIPQVRAGRLSAHIIRRLSSGPFPVLQLDATAYPGNSGSPVYDPDSGEVLGIVNMVFVKGTKESVLTQPSGITYAIPVSHLRGLLRNLR